jgi:hypothetical protein
LYLKHILELLHISFSLSYLNEGNDKDETEDLRKPHRLKNFQKLFLDCESLREFVLLSIRQSWLIIITIMLNHNIVRLQWFCWMTEESLLFVLPRFLRIGSMILALHDASDLILELAKLCKYSGRELSASICFGLFAISWFFLRMVYFPFWVIKSSRWDSRGR